MLTLPGQEKAARVLSSYITGQRLPQALLFIGPPGTGRKEAALRYAQALNCRTEAGEIPCGECLSCRKIASGIHPDVEIVGKTGQTLKIETLREIQGKAALKPLEARAKVYILAGAQSMTEEAANSFLKIMEEPPAGVVFILIAESLTGLLPTVVSRCQMVSFSPLREEFILEQLMEDPALSAERARKIAALSAGSLERARELLENEEEVAFRDEVLGAADRFRSASLYEMIELAGRWAREEKEEKKKAESDKAGREEEASSGVRNEDKRTAMNEVVELLLTWFRDILILEEGAEEALVLNQDRLPILRKWQGILTKVRLQEILEDLLEARRQIRRNANARLIFQSLFARINDKMNIREEM